MKLPLNWIREYAPIPVAPEDYRARMIMCGTAVEGIEWPGREVEGVVVGRVLTCVRHADSDHLHVCTVDAGGNDPLQIVCGAPNVRQGILAPVALCGARLPGGHVIRKGKIRGAESCGMLCSAEELHVPQELYPSVGAEGLLIFTEEYPPGSDVRTIFGLDDAIADFEILANRPDCLCVWGIARETAAALGTRLTLPEIRVAETGGSIARHARVTVEAPGLCSRYCARVVTNVRIGPSPLWLRRRLHAAGVRPINNIVDITNYVMLETGHPMHAFDLARVSGRHIRVREATAGERLTTLDGKTHSLAGGELLICDEGGPTGLAGIMGGLESEITPETGEILFECAAFDRTRTRVTARSLGIRTESSGRFERGVSPATALAALDRACQLVGLLAAGDVVAGQIDLYPHPVPRSVVTGSVKRIARRTGVDIGADEMVSILRLLGFEADIHGDRLTAVAPEYRQDIEQEADLCEEVLRMAGYGRIPSTRLRGETTPGGESESRSRRKRLASVLHGLGYDEMMAFSFISQGQLDKLGLDKDDGRLDPVRIRNPLGEDTSCLRSSLLPGVLKALSTNMNRGAGEGRLCEFGTVFDAGVRTDEGLVREESWLCLGCFGKENSFHYVRDTVLALCEREGVACSLVPGGENYHHPGRCALVLSDGERIASVGELHPDTAERFELPERAWVAELCLDSFFRHASPMGTVKSPPRTPAVARDLALVMPESQLLMTVMDAIRETAGPLLERISLFDVYRGAQVAEGMKSAAFSLLFRSPDHTLEEGEVQLLLDRVLGVCRERFSAAIRA